MTQPVKKRSRYANPTAPTVPQGFVRDELDDDDSADDPDFEADELDPAEDEDDEPYDAFEEQDLGFVGVRTRTSHHEHARQLESTLNDPNLEHATFLDAFGAAEDGRGGEDFEVDDLDSTDDENSAGLIGFRDLAHVVPAEDRSRTGDGSSFGREDDEDDDYDEEGEDDEDANPIENPADDYQRFLRGLLAESASIEHRDNSRGAGEEIQGSAEPPSWAMDDDEDFDYLRESARVHDDPLEYRDDYHVSRKELVQLLSSGKGTNLRRHTRHAKARSNGRGVRDTSAAPPISIPLSVLQPALGVTGASPAVPTAVGASITPVVPSPANVQVPTFVAPPAAGYGCLPPATMLRYREQLGVHVQILTGLHANLMAKVKTAEEGRSAGNSQPDEPDLAAAKQSVKRSETLIRGLIDNKRVSTLYHQVVATNMARLKPFEENIVNPAKNAMLRFENMRRSVYSLPVLDLLEPFLRDCTTMPASSLPASALQPFQRFNRPDIAQALRPRRGQRHYVGSHTKPGWYAWSSSDDALLAMAIAKYGSDNVEFSKDLLPHRQNEDCLTRIRYLSSRRCPDNPVKRQVMLVSAPLSKAELEIVQKGLVMYGGNTDDPEVWKRIQRNLLPGRAWPYLQKLWTWRETRRKYKAKYRAKASEKKKAAQEGAAPA